MKSNHLYQALASEIESQIKNQVLKIGDKLPSIRTICAEKGVSKNTVVNAYLELERKGIIESRPQSGYYVSYAHHLFNSIVSPYNPKMVKNANSMEEVMQMVVENFYKAKIYLSSASLSKQLVPVKKLNEALIMATKTLSDSGIGYNKEGSIKLKKNIVKRALSWGGKFHYNDIITTAGSIDAVAFCLMTLAQKGDVIAVESPTYYGILRLAHSLGLQVIESPTHPLYGVDIDALSNLMKLKKIKLCILVSNFSNPLGSVMPAENKKMIVQAAERYNIPIIEDDVYGELAFDNHRPVNCKTYDESGMVLWCGSFSKTLVSGYRVGWIEAGKYKEAVERTKLYHSLYSSTITHEAVGNFMEMGRYDLHLIKLRKELYDNYLRLQKNISTYFPEHTKVTHPTGGMNLWLEFDKKFDALELYNKAILNKISISPGRVYTLQNQYNNCIKLSFGQKWDETTEHAFKTLGKLAIGIQLNA